jgi:transcription termination/antitermination protein NusG
MSNIANIDRWYALNVRTRWESSTANLLSGKGYRTLLPTYKARQRARSAQREIVAPLFPGYVFCQFDVNNRLPILVTPGVLSVVGTGRTPISVDDSEIAAIERVVACGLPAEPWPYLEVGQRIRIQTGALSGLEGILTSFRGSHRIVVSVSLLCRSVSLEIQRSEVSAVSAPGAVAGSVTLVPSLGNAVA